MDFKPMGQAGNSLSSRIWLKPKELERRENIKNQSVGNLN